MADYDLDLDLLIPEPKRVKLAGQVYAVNPPTVQDLAELSRLAGKLSNQDKEKNSEEVTQALNSMIEVCTNFMPALAGARITINQMIGLIEFVNTMVATDQNGPLKDANISVTGTEKKTLSE